MVSLLCGRDEAPARTALAGGGDMTARGPKGLVGWPQMEPALASRYGVGARDHLSLVERAEGRERSHAGATDGIRAEGPQWT